MPNATPIIPAVRPHRYGIQKAQPVVCEGKPAFRAVCDLHLEGIVAKRLDDAYGSRTKWWKIRNPAYSQRAGRTELFERRGRSPGPTEVAQR